MSSQSSQLIYNTFVSIFRWNFHTKPTFESLKATYLSGLVSPLSRLFLVSKGRIWLSIDYYQKKINFNFQYLHNNLFAINMNWSSSINFNKDLKFVSSFFFADSDIWGLKFDFFFTRLGVLFYIRQIIDGELFVNYYLLFILL